MLGWLYRAGERCTRVSAPRTARMLDYIPRWVIHRLAGAKLVHTLRHVWRHSAFQRQRWQQAGLRRSDLRSPRVLRRIPFLDATDLALHPEHYYCVPSDQLIHIITTSGTTGQVKRLYFTADDVERQTRMMGEKLRRLPGASHALAVYSVLHATWSSGAFARRGIEQAGMFGLLAGTHLPPAEHIKLIKEYNINLLISTPSFVHRMTLEADEDLKRLGVKYIVLATQPWTEDLRREIESAWGAKVLDAYGTNECGSGMAGECPEQNGLHVAETEFWLEVIDPETTEPMEEGQLGELVVTTLSRRGMPLVRHRTGDLARMLDDRERCPCGMPVRRISRILGRTDNMVVLGAGGNVFPNEVDEAVFAVPGVTDYQLVIEKDQHQDVLHLTVESPDPKADLLAALREALMGIEIIQWAHGTTRTLVFGRFRNVPCGTLAGDRPKSIRILDRRPAAAAHTDAS